jgi:hypothetical protein
MRREKREAAVRDVNMVEERLNDLILLMHVLGDKVKHTFEVLPGQKPLSLDGTTGLDPLSWSVSIEMLCCFVLIEVHLGFPPA